MLSSLWILEKTPISPFHQFNLNPTTTTTISILRLPLTPPLNPFLLRCSTNDSTASPSTTPTIFTPPIKKRKRYRKLYPGESEGIVEEMRFVAMKLRNDKHGSKKNYVSEEEGEESDSCSDNNSDGDSGNESGDEETWEPRIDGFLNYLVDSKLVFETLERIVDESSDVSYAYFRKTGLERSEVLSKDLEWFSQQNLVIPEPTNAGVSYAKYLEELADKSAPMFLCHFYNNYFAHISGGQVITKKVSQKLLEGREVGFCTWEGDELELLKDVRDKLNQLGEHWVRDDKNKCLRESAKSFRLLGQIVRLIIT